MPKPSCSIAELIRLYTDEDLTLQQIADKFSISRQTVYERLRKAGIKFRPRSRRTLNISGPELYDLYVTKQMTPAKIGKKLGRGKENIRQYLLKHKVPMRGRGESFVKYPQIQEMKPGESIELPKPARKNPYTDYYLMAKKAGIRVSMQTIDSETLRLTRVE